MKEKATSFFFMNFPENWDTKALWKMFDRYGKVVDVYIAFKRTKKNTSGIETSTDDFPPINPNGKSRAKSGTSHPSQSYREVVVGDTTKTNPIYIEEDKNIRARLESCWSGEAKNLQVLQNTRDIIESNGLVDCKVKYYGGLSLLFEWGSKDEAKDLRMGRLTWVCIEGLPLLGRYHGAIKSIVKYLGRILEVGRLDFNSKLILPVKVLMLVPTMKEVSCLIPITLNGTTYPLWVFEEPYFVSSLLSPLRDLEIESMFEEDFVGPSMIEEDGGDMDFP
ncbi:nucleotide-binding alpha-beta plait domain-containing protein, partial [Tanacetum coccineum]